MTVNIHDEFVRCYIMKCRVLGTLGPNKHREEYVHKVHNGERIDVDWRGWGRYADEVGLFPVYAIGVYDGKYAYVHDKFAAYDSAIILGHVQI